MNAKNFQKAVRQQRLRGTATIKACRLVLVGGDTQAAAAAKIGVTEALVSRALKRLRSNSCPTCGRPF